MDLQDQTRWDLMKSLAEEISRLEGVEKSIKLRIDRDHRLLADVRTRKLGHQKRLDSLVQGQLSLDDYCAGATKT